MRMNKMKSKKKKEKKRIYIIDMETGTQTSNYKLTQFHKEKINESRTAKTRRKKINIDRIKIDRSNTKSPN